MVIWLIGLSAAGKSTVGRKLYDTLKPGHRPLVFVDGDDLRRVLGNDLGYSLEDRRKNAERVCRVCAWLESQGVDVICAILSLFEESRIWNRAHYDQYVEVYLRASIEALRRRETKGLYQRQADGQISGVAGVDLPFEEPVQPDLVLDVDDPPPPVDALVDRVLTHLRERGWGPAQAVDGRRPA